MMEDSRGMILGTRTSSHYLKLVTFFLKHANQNGVDALLRRLPLPKSKWNSRRALSKPLPF